MSTHLIYCADGNKRFAEIAIRRGYSYGACLPNTVYFTPVFTDQKWKEFNKAKTAQRRAELRAAYFATLERYRPRLATVLDWERQEQLPEVVSWAYEAAQWVTEAVIVIPKVVGGIAQLSRLFPDQKIADVQLRLGYSCSSTFSSTPVTTSEFQGWHVHALGGGVAAQMDLARKCNVVSADGNYIQNQARLRCQFYSPSTPGKHKGWPRLSEAGIYTKIDSPYLAFELTCIGVPMAWNGATGQEIYEAQREYLKSIDMLPAQHQLSLFGAVA